MLAALVSLATICLSPMDTVVPYFFVEPSSISDEVSYSISAL